MDQMRFIKIDANKNMRRFYTIRTNWQLPLFSGETLTTIHGRIGRWSSVKTVCLEDPAILQEHLESILELRERHQYRMKKMVPKAV